MKCYVTSIENVTAKNGKPFLKAEVRTAEKKQVLLYVWQNIEGFSEAVHQSPILDITAKWDDQFPEVTQFFVTQGNTADFVETAFVSDEYADTLLDKILSFITEPEYVALNNKLFAKGSDTRQRFITFPAAKLHHHNIRGGLLLHTYEVLQFVSMVSKDPIESEGLDRQVLLEGALLHDVGKILDYTFDGVAIEYSARMFLGNHLATGADFITRLADNPYSPKMEAIKHIIRSHHLQESWGAITPPRTREAILVFFGDYYSMFKTKTLGADYNDNGIASLSKSETYIDMEKAMTADPFSI